jgi:hypothetical protein
MDQKSLSRAQPAAVEDIGPDGEEGLGQGPGLDHIHPLGDRQALRRRGSAEFGIAAAGNQSGHRVAHPPARYPLAKRRDPASDLQPRDVGSPRRRLVATLALHHIGPIDAGRGDLDQQLALSRPGDGPLGRPQDLGSPETGDLDGDHAVGHGFLYPVRKRYPDQPMSNSPFLKEATF